MDTTGTATITETYHDASIDSLVVITEPVRTVDTSRGFDCLADEWYLDAGQVIASGFRVKKDGTPAAQRITLHVEVPANVREVLGA